LKPQACNINILRLYMTITMTTVSDATTWSRTLEASLRHREASFTLLEAPYVTLVEDDTVVMIVNYNRNMFIRQATVLGF